VQHLVWMLSKYTLIDKLALNCTIHALRWQQEGRLKKLLGAQHLLAVKKFICKA